MWEKKSLGQAGTARKGDMVPMTREEEADGKGLGEVCGWDSCATCFLQGLGAGRGPDFFRFGNIHRDLPIEYPHNPNALSWKCLEYRHSNFGACQSALDCWPRVQS